MLLGHNTTGHSNVIPAIDLNVISIQPFIDKYTQMSFSSRCVIDGPDAGIEPATPCVISGPLSHYAIQVVITFYSLGNTYCVNVVKELECLDIHMTMKSVFGSIALLTIFFITHLARSNPFGHNISYLRFPVRHPWFDNQSAPSSQDRSSTSSTNITMTELLLGPIFRNFIYVVIY